MMVTHQIDGTFTSLYIDYTGAKLIPFFHGIGHHRAIVFDILHHVIFGGKLHKLKSFSTKTTVFVHQV